MSQHPPSESTPGAAKPAPVAEVIVYRTPTCAYCVRVHHLLQKKGVAFREVDVSEDAVKRDWLIAATGRRTVPQVFINGKPYGGFDDLAALDRAGKLDGLLAVAKG